MKLTLLEKTESTQRWRTEDGRFDVFGVDLNCTSRAARAAGAGPVWAWQPATDNPDWYDGEGRSRSFTRKTDCVLDLERNNGDHQ